jgi:polysaccharide biosynthesis transport protein
VASTSSSSDLDLRHYLSVIRRRKGTITLALLIVLGATLAATAAQTPVYSATAKIRYSYSLPSQTVLEPQSARGDIERALQTEVDAVESEAVKVGVREELGKAPDVTVSLVDNANILTVTAESTNREEAAAIANAYVNSYVTYRNESLTSDYEEALPGIVAQIENQQSALGPLTAELDAARAESDETKDPSILAEATQRLQPQIDAVNNQISVLQQQANALSLQASVPQNGAADVLAAASVPRGPVRPQPTRNAALGGAVGLLFGIGLAFLFEYLDDSVKTSEDVESLTGGIPTLGLIPAIDWKDKAQTQLVSISKPSSPAAEAYRSLRTSVQFLSLERNLQVVQLTSPSASEGKTTTLTNLGVAMARSGLRVVVVDCDLRRPRLMDFFGLSNHIGFTSVLLGESPLSAAVQQVPDEARLFVLASGPLPPNPSELLASRRADEVVDALRAEFDVVLIDSPPVLPVTDAAVLSRVVDGTLLVATVRTTRKKALLRAVEALRQVDAPIVGTVLNGLPVDSAYASSYTYHHYSASPYGQEPKKRRGRKGRKGEAQAAAPDWEAPLTVGARSGNGSGATSATREPDEPATTPTRQR